MEVKENMIAAQTARMFLGGLPIDGIEMIGFISNSF
jgi:hypothetical protein